jgi:hypothetical protein
MNDPHPLGPFEEEEKNIRRLRKIVDRTTESLLDDLLSEQEARELIENTRRNVLALFPDKQEEFALIYRPRFERLLEANPGVQCDRALREAPDRSKGGEDAKT